MPSSTELVLTGADVLIAIGSARALPGRRDDLVAAACDMVTATRRDDGCESYGFFADVADADTVISVEVWRDQADLDSHMSHPHTQEFLALSATLVEGNPTLAIHRVLDPT